MGCIARLGCLVVLAILCVAAWFTRNTWLPEKYRSQAAAPATWQAASPAGAERASSALTKLSQPRGPVFQNLSAGDVASLALREMSPTVARATDSVSARIDGDRMTMRASLRLDQLKGKLGPLAGMLNDRETVEMSGGFVVIKPGVAGFVVQSARVGRVNLPQGMIPRLVQEINGGVPADGLPENALRLPVPSYVGDIRVANGRVTLYKNVQ